MVKETDSDVVFPEAGAVKETGMLIVGVVDSDFCKGDLTPGVVGVANEEHKIINHIIMVGKSIYLST